MACVRHANGAVRVDFGEWKTVTSLPHGDSYELLSAFSRHYAVGIMLLLMLPVLLLAALLGASLLRHRHLRHRRRP